MPAAVQDHIRISRVSVSFTLATEVFTALDEVSLDIAEGEVLALVGPSGCGKTTILNLIAGFTRPTEGTLTVAGAPVTGPGADRAVVFQADAVFPWLTVRRNLEYGPRIRKSYDAAAAERVAYYLTAMGLERFEHEYPKVLSGGMRKRVDVARAYVNEPSVILLDEPFGALDDMTKSYLQEELVRLSVSDPKTCIFVTHDIEEALYVGDRVAVMATRPGRVREVITVPWDRPRAADLRTAPEFQDLRRQIQGLLRSAAPAGDE